MNIFSALLLTALLQLGVVTGGTKGVFAASEEVVPNDAPLSSKTKSAKASSDDDIDYDEVTDLMDAAGGFQGVLALVFLYNSGDETNDEAPSARMLSGELSLLSDITCENNQNKTILAAVETNQMANFLNATINCYTPPTTTGRLTRPGNILKCVAIAKSFDAAINLDGCVSSLELLKRTIQLKKIQRSRKKATTAA
ncbi:hypothetical protein ACHAWT_000092 [Skeletonema menzelii]|eukprot:scaffold8509_cov127-Skeletonema_menzelii.AAC.1